MWDSCGMMVIVEDIDEIYEFVKFFEENLTTREGGLSDYVQNPKAGYRSVHMYSTFEAEGITVPSEIQIKTEAMSIAQDTVHDSVYKLQDLPYEKEMNYLQLCSLFLRNQQMQINLKKEEI